MHVLVFLTELALAAPPAAEADDGPAVRVSLRGVAEAWSDGAIATVYAPGGLLGALGVAAPLRGPVGLSAELGYKRLEHGDTGPLADGEAAPTPDYATAPLLELIPVTLLAQLTVLDRDALDAYVAAGPAVVAFTERHAPGDDGLAATSGLRIAAELRAGVLIDTGLIRPPAAPAPSPVQALEIELYGARRLQRPGVPGLDLGAWRAGAGLCLRL